MNTLYQPGILEPIPAVARYVVFSLADPGADAQSIKDALLRLSPLADGSDVVLGLGPSLVAALGAQVPGLHEFPDFSGHGVEVPSTPGTLWCWVRGDDLGDLLPPDAQGPEGAGACNSRCATSSMPSGTRWARAATAAT